MTCGEVDLACTKCRLSAKRIQVVPGNGSCRSAIMFVGEAPGKDEDILGEPFVGRAGKLLDETLSELGIERSSVFVTNICLCRPPNNRKPRMDEVGTCTSLYLTSAVKAVRPRVVCALGQTAASYLLGTSDRMSRLVGKGYSRTLFGVRTTVHVAYHPAGALRQRSNMPSFKKAIRASLRAAGMI